MHTAVAMLEGNMQRVNELLSRPGMDTLEEADIPTLFDAISAWRQLGKVDKAKQLLELSQRKLQDIEEGNEKTISAMLVSKGEEVIGEHKPLALDYNKRGLERYSAKQFTQAIGHFYKAYSLFPRELAFSLNLLQGLVDAGITRYKNIVTVEFLDELQHRKLNDSNRKRLDEIVGRLHKKAELFYASEAQAPAEG